MSKAEFVLSNEPGTLEAKRFNAVAPQPKAPEGEPPPSAATPEEIQAAAKEMVSSMFGDDSPPSPLPATSGDMNPFVPAPVAPAPETVVPPAGTETVAPGSETVKPPGETVPPETTTVAPKTETVAPEPKQAPIQPPVQPKLEQPPAEPPIAPVQESETEGMNPDDTEDYKAIRFLEETNPKFAGKADEFKAYVTKHYAYADQWEKDHPGQTYNPDDAEHEEWYDKNQPAISPKDLESAKIEMRVEERIAKRVDPEIRKMKQEKAFEKARPQITREVDDSVVALVEAVNPELAAMVRTADGAPDLTAESLAKLEESDPIAAKIMDTTVSLMKPMIQALAMVKVEELDYRLNPARNPVHAEIDVYLRKLESDMKHAPAEQKKDAEGREFKTINEYLKGKSDIQRGTGTSAEKSQKLQEFENSCWTITPTQIKEMIVHDVATKTKELIEQTDQLAVKKYGNQRVSAKKPDQPALQTEPIPPTAQPKPDNGKPKPPSMASGSDIVTPPKNVGGGTKTFGQSITENLFS